MSYQGLFTQGITVDELLAQRSKRQQDMQQQLMNQAAQGARDPQRARMGSMFGSILGRALGDNAGGADTERQALEAKNAQQKEYQAKYGMELTQGTPESNLTMGNELIKLGYVDRGGELINLGKEGLKEKRAKEALAAEQVKEQALRESLVTQATNLGLSSTASMVENGGDLKEAAKAIRDQETLSIIQTGGRKGRISLAITNGASAAMIREIATGKHDTMSDSMFLATIEGKEATIKFFKDSSGVAKPFRVDKGGKVWDRPSMSWVFPSELSLSMAPQLTEEVNQLDQITTAMIGTEVQNYATYSEKANDAVMALEVNNTSSQIFNEGIVSGFAGNFKLQAGKALIAAGVASDEIEGIVSNTETYLAHRGLAVANVIKAFGSGTGLSDADREYARQIVGGEITMDEGAMSNLLRIEREGYFSLIENHNSIIDRLGDIGGKNGVPWEKAKNFYIPVPDYSSQQSTPTSLSTNALKYIK